MLRCAEIVKAGQPLKLVERPLPTTPADGLMIKTSYAGVCHSDVHFLEDELSIGKGKVDRYRDIYGEEGLTGIVLGHEISGIVHALGKNVRSKSSPIQVGDRVVVYSWSACEQCEVCLAGSPNMCENNPHGFHCTGQSKLRSGGYSTFVPVDDIKVVVKVPDTVPMDLACMFPCSALTAYSALEKCARSLESGDAIRGRANLLIIGAGGLGLWAVKLVKYIFSDINVSIICADIAQDKLELATKAGAELTVLWDKKDPIEALVRQTTNSNQDKIDAAVDFVGSPKTMSVAVHSLHSGGTVVPVGFAGGALNDIPIPLLVARSISIHGSRTGPMQTFKDMVQQLGDDAENLSFPNIEYYTLDDVNNVLEKLKNGEIKGRAVIKFE